MVRERVKKMLFLYAKKKACSMHKVHSKGNFKCGRLFVRMSAQQQQKRELPLDTVRDSLGNSFILTAAHEAPVPENKIFISDYSRIMLVQRSPYYYYAGILGSGLHTYLSSAGLWQIRSHIT